MFERYTEKARRVIFFARYEASQTGNPRIGTEHLLLGILRESKGLSRQLNIDPSEVRRRIPEKTRERISTSVDLPLDDASKRALAYAAEEAEQMGHSHIGTEHLLLGIMREANSEAARVLKAVGVPGLDEVRKFIRESEPEQPGAGGNIGSGSRADVMPAVVTLIEQESGRKFSMRLRFVGVPRIGEAVRITPQEGNAEIYRVVDVQWSFRSTPAGDDLLMNALEVRIRREETAGG